MNTELPSGTITLLLTDVEGSTKLWERHSSSMRRIMARHDEIAASLINACDGVLVKPRGEGDSLFVVFRFATDAVACALGLQQEFVAESWHEGLDICVRMGVHSGEAALRDGDYYGSAVNRCARLRAIAQGGQILLSLAAEELCRDSLPADCGLLDLGEHRLRDLARPERVYQLTGPNIPTDFGPLRSLNVLPNNLPRQFTSFVGRAAEIETIKGLLANNPVVTLTGSGGAGKDPPLLADSS